MKSTPKTHSISVIIPLHLTEWYASNNLIGIINKVTIITHTHIPRDVTWIWRWTHPSWENRFLSVPLLPSCQTSSCTGYSLSSTNSVVGPWSWATQCHQFYPTLLSNAQLTMPRILTTCMASLLMAGIGKLGVLLWARSVGPRAGSMTRTWPRWNRRRRSTGAGGTHSAPLWTPSISVSAPPTTNSDCSSTLWSTHSSWKYWSAGTWSAATNLPTILSVFRGLFSGSECGCRRKLE